MSFPETQFFYYVLSLVCYEHQSIFCNCCLKFPVSAVTLDYKALPLLLNKKNDEDFLLGGKGYGVEFCDAIGVIISLDIFLALNYFIDLWSDQFSESRMASSQIWGRHGCSEKQPLTTLFCRVECLYLLVRCMKIPKKWLLIKYLFSLRPVHAMELMQMKPV